jgi:hypothetical protein
MIIGEFISKVRFTAVRGNRRMFFSCTLMAMIDEGRFEDINNVIHIYYVYIHTIEGDINRFPSFIHR